MHVKSGDTVVVIAGKDKGKKGKVLTVIPKEKRVIVEGVNIVTKHKKTSGTNISRRNYKDGSTIRFIKSNVLL
jgi:large subunit ribosomal protein L24